MRCWSDERERFWPEWPKPFLPPYSPESNAIGRFWLYLKERVHSQRLRPDDDTIVEAVGQAWRKVTSDADRIVVCSTDWVEAVKN